MTKNKVPSRAEILAALDASAYHPLRSRDLARQLHVPPDAYRAFRRSLRELEREGLLIRRRGGGLVAPNRAKQIVGRLEVIRSGDGFVVPDEPGDEDVFVAAERMDTAVEGDRVAVALRRRRSGRNPEGEIVRVLERAITHAVGVYHVRAGGGYVVPQEPSLRANVLIPGNRAGEARVGDVVQVIVREWGAGELRPVGDVVRVLGRPGDPGVDVLSILVGHGLPLEFPAEAREEAERIERRGVRPEDAAGREDLRGMLAFTIDPADARDHDDALSVQSLQDGAVEVGVHIADVSYYVKSGSFVDREALARATSVYLVDRAIPMLPEGLSAGLCSLVEGQDRLTLSVLFRWNREGEITGRRIARAVIRSRHRLSYETAQAILDRDPKETVSEGRSSDFPSGQAHSELREALRQLADISRRLRNRRQERGAIDFDIPEAQVVLDPDGVPTAIRARRRLETHRIVEDFMILANESVAEWGLRQGLPLVYRIHEEPDEDKMEGLRQLAGAFGYALAPGRVRPQDLERLVRSAEGTDHSYLISSVALRSMRQARYSTRNVGHYGLASSAYLHFTSPIRRYPDLLVHRVVVAGLAGRRGPGTDPERLESMARHASEQERRAEAAERDSVDAKKVEYMLRHTGDEFDGTISGVTRFGFFALLDDVFVEGLVRVSSLRDDFYVYEEERHALVGRRSRRRLRLGDRVRVQVVRVDRETRQVDLELVAGPLDRGGTGS